MTTPPPLERARTAAARGDWHQAYELLSQLDAGPGVTGPDLGLLATTAYAAGHVDVTIDAWERAHAEALRRDDRIDAAAAAARVALHMLLDTALLAPVRGWTARAERLLTGHEDTPIHAWLAVVRSYERLLSGDFDRAAEWAQRAIAVGAVHDASAAAMGRVAEARCVILTGEVARGVDLLNEAAVAAVSGEIDPLTTGIVYCEVVCALQAIAQYDLAEQWTAAMEHWSQRSAVGSIHGRCRLHRAEILRLRGAYGDAETEATGACEELRPYLRREFGWPLTELGRIRLRKGDLEGAQQAFTAAQEAGWDPQPGLALLHLARGDTTMAAALIRTALDHPVSVPSKELPPNSDFRQAPLLEADVEIAIAIGDIPRAQWAAGELSRIAAAVESAAFKAAAAIAQGRVRLALGDPESAAERFRSAVHQWSGIGAPCETATARLLLGRALAASGNDVAATVEVHAASEAFRSLGVPPPLLHEPARPAPGAASSSRAPAPQPVATGPSCNAFTREGEYWSLAFDGHATRVRDAKGMRYLARLLADPGRQWHALDLVIEEQGDQPDATGADRPRGSRAHPGDAGAVLDRRARETYRRRLAEIEDDLEEARRVNDTARAEQAAAERSFLARELARAVGLGGRERRVGSAAERARASVTRAIRHAIARIEAHHPALGTHLDWAIRTGTYCTYLPDPRAAASAAWTVRL